MIPGEGAALLVLALAGVLGGVVAWRWLATLSRLLPSRVLMLHVAAGPFMVLGTIPLFLAWWVWRARIGDMISGSGSSASGAWGVGWQVVVLAGLGGMLWLGGLRCLLEGHRVLRKETPMEGGAPSVRSTP